MRYVNVRPLKALVCCTDRLRLFIVSDNITDRNPQRNKNVFLYISLFVIVRDQVSFKGKLAKYSVVTLKIF